jgi:hypothetical protein
MMHGREKSDRCVVPLKRPNRAERSAAEGVEGRHLLKGSARRQRARRTLCRTTCVSCAALAAQQNCMGCPNPERCHAITFERSPVRASRTPGSVRGEASNRLPYRDRHLWMNFFLYGPPPPESANALSSSPSRGEGLALVIPVASPLAWSRRAGRRAPGACARPRSRRGRAGR